MPKEISEEELLRSIDDVDARIRDFRNRVRALLASMEAHTGASRQTDANAET